MSRHGISGQAMVELAIFGSIFITVMGAMIGYGLSADYQQRVQMQTFREALRTSASALKTVIPPGTNTPPTKTNNIPLSRSVTYFQDKAMVDPSNPFDMGDISPFSASASSAPRTMFMGDSADNLQELPKQLISVFDKGKMVLQDCPGGGGKGCATSGFRKINAVLGWKKDDNGSIVNDPKQFTALDRYDDIYGINNVRRLTCTAATPMACDIRITDPVSGQIVDKGTATRICRQSLDASACKKECIKARSGDSKSVTECNQICAQVVVTPWYCDVANPPTFTSPGLNNLFVIPGQPKPIDSMGIQQGLTKDIRIDASRNNTTTAGAYKSADTITSWRADLQRTMVSRKMSANNTTSGGQLKKTIKTIPKNEKSKTTTTTPK